MKKITLLLSFIGFCLYGFSQNLENQIIKTVVIENKPTDSNYVFSVVEEMPQFPGGNDARIEFLKGNIIYPKSARKKGISGTVFANFIVEKDGSISNITVLRGVHPDIDAEVIRVILLFPKWIPGKENGKTVRVSFNLPIRFIL